MKPVIQDPRKKAESEADKFFGISEPLSESGEPIRKTQGRTEPDLSFLKQQAKIQEQKAVTVSKNSASKYLEIRPDAGSRNFATDEAVVEEDEWTKAYIQVPLLLRLSTARGLSAPFLPCAWLGPALISYAAVPARPQPIHTSAPVSRPGPPRSRARGEPQECGEGNFSCRLLP
jgi:hypothetical protein